MGKNLAQHLQRALATLQSLAFIGCSGTLEDPNFGALLTWMRDTLSGAAHRHYLLVREGEPLSVPEPLLREARIVPLRYGSAHTDLLSYIQSLVSNRASKRATGADGSSSPPMVFRPANGPDRTLFNRTLFISYRVGDTGPTASRLSEELAEAYGAECVFLDHERLEGGVVWPERLEAEARRASVMLVLIGEGWLRAQDPETFVRRLDQKGDWVRKEIETALDAGSLVVPLLVEGAEPLSREAFETVPSLAPLADRQTLPLRRRDWASDLERLHELLAANGLIRHVRLTNVPAEQLDALVRQRMTPLQEELADVQKRLIARLERELELNERQLRAALEAAGKAKVPPEQLAAKLGETASHYKTLREEVQPAPGDNPRARELKAQASQAIEEGGLERADKLISAALEGPPSPPKTHIDVINNNEQRARLYISPKGLEYQLTNRKNHEEDDQWVISKSLATKIIRNKTISVKRADKSGMGLFSIGPRRDWVYSARLFPEPDTLYKKIEDLLNAVIRQSSG